MADLSILLKRLEQGTATQADLQLFASRSGLNVGRDIANRLLEGDAGDAVAWILRALRQNYDEVTEYADGVQTLQYESIGVGLAPVSPAFDQTAARTLADEIMNIARDIIKTNIIAPRTERFAQDVADRHMSANAEAASRAGLTVRVSRQYDGVGLRNRTQNCQWCLARQCKNLDYEKAYALGAFQRHEGCHCVITYISEKGETTIQRGKGGWTRVNDRGLIEMRKRYGLSD